MDVRTVTTLIATDSAGSTVDSWPVREWIDGQRTASGVVAQPIGIAETANGTPIRFVDVEAVQNSVGRWVDVICVRSDGESGVGEAGHSIGLLLLLTKAS